MAGYSQKIYPEEELKERVTIRVLPEKMQVYPRFKDLVTKELGSDVCFITTSLWEAFLTAMDQVPPPDDQLEIKFLRQNVQINIGCNIVYSPKKARRTPLTPTLPKIEMKKNLFMPLVLDEWKTLDEKQKAMLRQQLIQEGIIEPPAPKKPKRKRKKRSDAGKPRRKRSSPPSVSTGKRKSKSKKFWNRMGNSMTNVTDRINRRLKKFLRRKN